MGIDAVSDAAPKHASAPLKVDPESLVLRARPPLAIRFKPSVIVGIAAVGCLVLTATVWLALKPGALVLVNPADDRNVLATPPKDALSSLPAGYGDVPRLGPPLPGDLGRPILERQRAMASETGGAGSAGSAADLAAASERDRLLAEAKAARESALLFKSGTSAQAGASDVIPQTSTARAETGAAVDPVGDPNAPQRKIDFVATVDGRGDSNPHRLVPLPSPFTLSAGSIISASLITGLRSDLPGLVIAQVTERVFDTATGRFELVPQGARLIGSYDSVVAFGQKRALVVWQRIIMPDGSSITLDNVPATDATGFAGLADRVDFHTWTILKGVAISTLLGVGSSLSFSGESDLVQAIQQSAQQNTARAGDQITARNLQVQPTITVRPGTIVKLVVHRDLILAPRRS